MTDLLLRIGLSNVCISLALAIVAMVVEATVKRPPLTHLLWLLVFVKLVTPPVLMIPIVTISGSPDSTVVALNVHSRQELRVTGNRELDMDEGQFEGAYLSSESWSMVLDYGKTGLSLIWILGSVLVFAWSLFRVYRFNRLLGMEPEVAPKQLQTVAARIAYRLGLKAVPTIYATSAHLSPMVWWMGGKVRIVIPAPLLDQMDTRQLQWILAHELAHVRRRDYMIRWVEWLACVCFWWNPVVWWARHHLRSNEEICCDALVVSSLKAKPHTYADSLLTAVEYLARPALRPPAMASEINSGGFLERRFRMIVSDIPNRAKSRWLQACVLLCALVVLPFGVTYAQNYEAVGRRLIEAVEAGELSPRQAEAMMGALARASFAERLEAARRLRGERDRNEGIEGHFNRLGVSDETLGRIKRALFEKGIEREQIEPVLGGILRLVHGMKSEGEHFELDPRFRHYFEKEVGLTDEQIKLVLGIARRIVHGLKDSKRWR
jgi:beta-lactamase regulating signal transducer with metallopeptidase domain